MNVGNRELYAILNGQKEPDDVFSGDLAGGDVIYLALSGIFYLALVFLVEHLLKMGTISKYFSNE